MLAVEVSAGSPSRIAERHPRDALLELFRINSHLLQISDLYSDAWRDDAGLFRPLP